MKIVFSTAGRLVFCFAFCIFFSATSFATTYTFIGAGDWSDSDNWEDGIIPPNFIDNTDSILIDGTDDCYFNNPYGGLLIVQGTLIITVDHILTLDDGGIKLSEGDLVVDGILNIFAYQGVDYNNGTVKISGTVNVNSEEGLTTYNFSGGVVNLLSTGEVHVDGGSIFIRGSGSSIQAGGLLELTNFGRYEGVDGTLSNNGTIINGVDCTINLEFGNINNAGTLTNNGDITHLGGTVTGMGTLKGSGIIDFAYTTPNGGTLSPGNPLGCMRIDGDFVNNGTLAIQLSDGTACTNYDQLQVLNDHNVTLNDTIKILFPSGVPSTNTFTILTVTEDGTITANTPTIIWPAGYGGSGTVVGHSYQVSFFRAYNIYTFTGSGNWSDSDNWADGNIPPLELPNTDTIIINGTGDCVFDNPYNDYLLQVEGALILSSGKTLNIEEGNIRIAGGVFSVLGTLNCNTYGSIGYDDGIVNISGTVNVNEEECLNSSSSGLVNVLSTGAIHVNGGTMNIRGTGNIAAGGLLEINSGGRCDGYFGSLFNYGTLINGASCLIHLEYGVINNAGIFTNNGDITHYTGAVTGTGTLNGSGKISFDYTNEVGATLSPGNSPGCNTIDGEFENNGSLNIELADGTACTNYDQVHVINGHNIILNGTINILFPSGLPMTKTFTILTVTGGGTIDDNTPTINWPAGISGYGEVVGQSYQVTFSGILPVELVSFKASLTNASNVSLDWMTASETNNAAFQVERSTDSREWENIGTILGNGTSLEQHEYNFMDNNPHHGLNYYRLKQVDFDGQNTYSKVISIAMGNAGGNVHFQPNPTTGPTRLYIESEAVGNASLRIYNMVGTIMEEMAILQESEHQYHDLAIDLPAGIYFTVFSLDGQQWQQRLVVE